MFFEPDSQGKIFFRNGNFFVETPAHFEKADEQYFDGICENELFPTRVCFEKNLINLSTNLSTMAAKKRGLGWNGTFVAFCTEKEFLGTFRSLTCY